MHCHPAHSLGGPPPTEPPVLSFMIEHTHLGVYAHIVCGPRVALVRKSRGAYRGCLDLPGGGIEFGETPLQALRRELREEIGLAVESAQLVDAVSVTLNYREEPHGDVRLHHLGILYRVELAPETELTALDPSSDTIGGRLYAPPELATEDLSPFAAHVIAPGRASRFPAVDADAREHPRR